MMPPAAPPLPPAAMVNVVPAAVTVRPLGMVTVGDVRESVPVVVRLTPKVSDVTALKTMARRWWLCRGAARRINRQITAVVEREGLSGIRDDARQRVDAVVAREVDGIGRQQIQASNSEGTGAGAVRDAAESPKSQTTDVRERDRALTVISPA